MKSSKNKLFSFQVIFSLGIISILLFLFFAYLGVQEKVLVVRAKVGDIKDSINGNVVVLADQSFDLRSEANARAVFSILSPHGKPVAVEANQTLFILDSSDLNRSLNSVLLRKDYYVKRLEAGSQLSSQIKIEEKDLEAVRAISQIDAIASLDLEKKESHVERLRISLAHEIISQEETLNSLDMEIERLKKEIKKSTIKSPISGILVSSTVKPEDFVFSSQIVGKVVSHSRLIKVSLSEEDFSDLKEGHLAGVTLFASKNKVYEGIVDRIAATIEPSTGRRNAFLKLDSTSSLPIGGSGRAEIIKRKVSQALIIPRKALLGDSVLCVRNNKVCITPVKVGATSLEAIQILEGLAEGDLVIAETPHLFYDEQKVNPSIINWLN
ncbi:MAG: HlyD family efflux transporter periplasmic adaptor subunit [Opitutales bacterium]|nr:HlyD family efflux transporter periplasmic adaptor subunit [Opitutales bacterium]